MEENKSSRPKWTMRTVATGKTTPFLIASIALSYPLFWAIANAYAAVQYYALSNTSLGQMYPNALHYPFIGIAFVISCFICAFLLRIVCNFVSPLKTGELAYLNDHATRFKWHILYTTVLGYVSFFGVIVIGAMLLDAKYKSDANTPLWLGFLVLVIAIGLPIFIKRFLHKKMIKWTRTNYKLLDDFFEGVYIDDIPEKFHNHEDLTEIALILIDARAHSVKSAVMVYSMQCAMRKLVNRIEKVLKPLVLIFTLGMLAYAAADYQRAQEEYKIDQLGRAIAKHTNTRVVIRRR